MCIYSFCAHDFGFSVVITLGRFSISSRHSVFFFFPLMDKIIILDLIFIFPFELLSYLNPQATSFQGKKNGITFGYLTDALCKYYFY